MSQKFNPYDHLNVELNQDGSITRLFDAPIQEPNPTPVQGEPTASKDVILNPTHKTTLRIFRPTNLPSNDRTVARLPIVLHFHSSGWILYPATTTVNHMACSQMASDLTVIVISVNYRLAPEHRLPAQYDDALEAILWVKNQAKESNGDEWIKDYADFSRCYLYGSSNGANIAFNGALRALQQDIAPLRIDGSVLYQPLFGGKTRTKSEIKNYSDPLLPLPVIDLTWELALPKGVDRDHRFCNPMNDDVYKEKMKKLGRCLVVGYGGDGVVDRQQEFVNMLVSIGVRVEARFDEAGFNGIEIIDPRRAAALLTMVREFIR